MSPSPLNKKRLWLLVRACSRVTVLSLWLSPLLFKEGLPTECGLWCLCARRGSVLSSSCSLSLCLSFCTHQTFFFFLFGSYLGNKVFCAPTLSELFASLGTCTKAEERKKVAMFGEKPFMANTFFSRGGSVACWVSWGAFQIPLTR